MRIQSIDSSRQSDASAARELRQPRIRHLLFAVAAIGLLSIGQAAAQEADESDSAQAAAPAGAKVGKNGKVCEYEVVTGSRMKKRVCHTPEQWEARERAAKQLTRELDRKPVGADASGI
ncbi:MAG TPA: hypothetical protein PLF73_09125 [Luteimonas sp.]|nr:hypothetical protein [Luteimonas sp.]HRO26051.1 hypothetical protein [Luteimonas sp.]